jgi:TonB C terminal
MRILLSATLAVALAASIVEAQAPPAPQGQGPAFRYVDDKGNIHWTQSMHLVPEAYVSRATAPSLQDPTIFPAVGPYVKRSGPTALTFTFQNQPQLASLHGWWAGQAARVVATAWKGRSHDGPQPTLAFYILRDGRLSIPEIEKSSGDFAYDLKARDALISVRRLPPLPPDFPGARVRVQLAFAHLR